jgi:O-acetyl-ADP-ribose deacetylase (regulator of RNase III)
MNVDNTLHPYQAFRAALLRAKDVGIESLVCPGLATGTGRACLELVARQMFVAYAHVVLQSKPVEFQHIYKQMVWMLKCSKDKRS